MILHRRHTPKQAYLSQGHSSNHSTNQITSTNRMLTFNTSQHNNHQLLPGISKTIDSHYTLNPEKNKLTHIIGSIIRRDLSWKKEGSKFEIDLGLEGKGKGKGKGKRVMMEEEVQRELVDMGDGLVESYDSMRRLCVSHKPLKQEISSTLQSSPAKQTRMHKLQQSQHILADEVFDLKSRQKKSKMYSTLSRMGLSEPEALMRLAKKTVELDAIPTNLILTNNRKHRGKSASRMERESEKVKRKELLDFGCALDQAHTEKIKADINRMTVNKTNNRGRKIEDLNETRNEHFEQKQQNEFLGISNRKFFSQVPKSQPILPPLIKITHKTSLPNLQQLLTKISQCQTGTKTTTIQILIPKILTTFPFPFPFPSPTSSPSISQLHSKGRQLLHNLSIPTCNLIIKKYSNCLLFLAEDLGQAVLVYGQGRIYVGGWAQEGAGGGSKEGLGLEYLPGVSVYFGEFRRSRKSGIGVERDSVQTYIGEWNQGKKTGNGHIIVNGEILHPLLSDGDEGHNDIEIDPFL